MNSVKNAFLTFLIVFALITIKIKCFEDNDYEQRVLSARLLVDRLSHALDDGRRPDDANDDAIDDALFECQINR